VFPTWRDDLYWKAIVSKCVVINYIEKFASKSNKGSNTFNDMLICISAIENPNEPVAHAYSGLLCETIVERDI
jgi:hypothetical protein